MNSNTGIKICYLLPRYQNTSKIIICKKMTKVYGSHSVLPEKNRQLSIKVAQKRFQ